MKLRLLGFQLEKTELKPFSDNPSIEKSQREIGIDKVNATGDVTIRTILTTAREEISKEPSISPRNLPQPSKHIR